ncbi:MAG: hypothetical protein QXO09_05960 [Candidatus Caldarchaeum sp.]
MPAPVLAIASRFALRAFIADRALSVVDNAINSFRDGFLERFRENFRKYHRIPLVDDVKDFIKGLETIANAIDNSPLLSKPTDIVFSVLATGLVTFLAFTPRPFRDAIQVLAQRLASEGDQPWKAAIGLEIMRIMDPKWIAETYREMKEKGEGTNQPAWRMQLFDAFAHAPATQQTKLTYNEIMNRSANIILNSLKSGKTPGEAFLNGLVAFSVAHLPGGQNILNQLEKFQEVPQQNQENFNREAATTILSQKAYSTGPSQAKPQVAMA